MQSRSVFQKTATEGFQDLKFEFNFNFKKLEFLNHRYTLNVVFKPLIFYAKTKWKEKDKQVLQ